MDSPICARQQCVTEADPAPAYGARVLLASAEIYPLAKTGGLADVAAALPQALADLGCDVRLVMPGYPAALEQIVAPRTLCEIDVPACAERVRIVAGRMPDTALPVWLVDAPALYRRSGGLYQDGDGRDWPDNAQRFGVFCRTLAVLAGPAISQTGWRPDVIHCNDWHTGLLPLLLRGQPRKPRTVFTIHNLAFQGNFPLACAAELNLPVDACHPDGAEFYGQLSFLKAGIRYADRISTVSPTYADEITGEEHGCGLHGVLLQRRSALRGILNGIDTAVWNPATDPCIEQRYTASKLQGKQACKRALQQQLGLVVDDARPLAVMLSRLTGQKMADVVLAELPGLLERQPELQFAMMGQGDAALEQGYIAIAAQYPGRLSVRIGYDEVSAHRLHAGGDLLIHGSRFEPCGLTQMYAMRYGTLPVVRRVGGLADTVVDAGEPGCNLGVPDATGFVFGECSAAAMTDAFERALQAWRAYPANWRRMQRNAMSQDFGWRRSAREYQDLLCGEGMPVRSHPPHRVASVGASGALVSC